jgi:putative ABC transport system permease protein
VGLRDLLLRAWSGISARPSRTLLSALGVAIGVGALVGVLGVSTSIQAGLLGRLTDLGDVMTVQSSNQSGHPSTVPSYALSQVRRIPTVIAVAGTRSLTESARRTYAVPANQSGGVSIVAFDGDVARATGTQVAIGRTVSGASPLPETVIGWQAAQALGVTAQLLPMRLSLGDSSVIAVGVLAPTPLESAADHAIFLPAAFARKTLGFDGRFDTVYVRAPLDFSSTVSSLIVPTIDPTGSLGLQVSRDSSALIAEADAATAFQGLLLALAGVGLLVAIFGVTNTLTIAVIERRTEIGVRRALGATRLSIAGLFVAEGTLVALCGGIGGIVFGTWATVIAAWQQGVAASMPMDAPLLGFVCALVVALVAAPYPALRAATLPPNDALRTMA